MASYEIVWKNSAERELRGTDKRYIPRIIEAVESLSENPFSLKPRKLQGVEATYRKSKRGRFYFIDIGDNLW